ncbi:class I SAM-dependent methyltransferase [uncultured Methanobacterium sp.]|uniref:class I SAM-dependent methyltransferase n=1 Tax=uncultured Methanobacterium sp. TaxID=176306 RepID=UPI002AA73B56|nr:class I SAM-dependent methyltransferase [uncultured Methanobacterium sp.]
MINVKPMVNVRPFENYSKKYDEWFDKNRFIYESELQAVKELLPSGKTGIEVGVGSGRFAAPLGIKLGLDPSRKMGEIAKKRGIKVIEGVAESLPFPDSHFDFILMVTTICFLDDVDRAFNEANRVLKPGGFIIIGFIDAESSLGKFYEEIRSKSEFYQHARFYSVNEVILLMKNAHFKNLCFRQALFQPVDKSRPLDKFQQLDEIKSTESVKKGYGEGSFIVVRGTKSIR